MQKIVIVGSPGAGKTTLAKNLQSILKIKVFHLDRLFWQPGWIGKTRAERIAILQDLVMKKQWIIEGTYLRSSELCFAAADTIIFLDIPFPLCLQRIFKRHREWRGRSRCDIPKGCTDKLSIRSVLKVLSFPFRGKKRIERKLREYSSKQIIWLHSDKEVEDFLKKQAQEMYTRRSSSGTTAATKERSLVKVGQ